MLRNREPYGAAQGTGEPLFDQDLYLEQSFHSDHRESTFLVLGYVMPYDPLADLIYTNSLSIGRTKMRNTSETAASSSRRLRTCKATQSAAAPSDKAVHGDLKQEGEPRLDDEAECESARFPRLTAVESHRKLEEKYFIIKQTWAPLHLCYEQHTNSVVVAKANLTG